MTQATLGILASAYSVSVADTVKTLADVSFGFSSSELQYADEALLTVETGSLRVTYEGTAPTTSSGHIIAIGNETIIGCDLIRAVKMIRNGSTSATVTVTLFKR